jgi:glycosyltransferase involved in cell wall biosynthesis
VGTNQKIKICHLISGDLWAGAEVQACTILASLLSVQDLDLSAVVLNEGRLSTELSKAGLRVTVIEEAKHGFFEILSLIEKSLRCIHADILHTHRYKENVVAGILKEKCGVKYLVQTVHGLDEPFKGIKRLKSKLYSGLNKHFSRRYFDIVLTVSYDIASRLSSTITSDKLVTIHNGIDIARIQTFRPNAEIKSILGMSENHPIIGSVGRMVPIKGYDIFLKGAKMILLSEPRARFLLVGDGPLRPQLEKMAEKMGIENEVKFLGFRDDVLDVMNCFDIFVLSSYYEGIPMALLEAMALGKAVVATRTGGICEIIENQVSGLLAEKGEPESLACACLKILNDPRLMKNLGIATQKRIEEEFSILVQRDRLAGIYRRLVSKV